MYYYFKIYFYAKSASTKDYKKCTIWFWTKLQTFKQNLYTGCQKGCRFSSDYHANSPHRGKSFDTPSLFRHIWYVYVPLAHIKCVNPFSLEWQFQDRSGCAWSGPEAPAAEHNKHTHADNDAGNNVGQNAYVSKPIIGLCNPINYKIASSTLLN